MLTKEQFIEDILEINPQYKVEKIVIGYPLNMNASKGPRAEKTDKFIQKLKDEFGLEVIKIDERLTTVAAHKTMTTLNIGKDKKKKIEN